MFKSAQRELSRRMGRGYDKALERKEWVLGHGRVQWLVGDREQVCGRLGQGHGKELGVRRGEPRQQPQGQQRQQCEA